MTKTFVGPEGNHGAKIAIVGEQPGRVELQSGRPFVGPAGRELQEDLQAIGLMRQDCYLTNYAKDFDEHVSKRLDLKTMTFTKLGMESKRMLIKELKELKTNVIVACGNYAMASLVSQGGITKWRGSVLECPELPGKFVIPTLHPATVIPPKNQYLNRFLIQFDLKRALRISERGYEKRYRNLITRPSFFQCLEYLEKCYNEGLKKTIVYFDIELYNEEVSCISFALMDTEAISIPFVVENGDYFSISQEMDIWKKVALILENPDIKKCGQNVGFDTHFLLRRYGIKAKNLHDTMVAQRIIMPDYKIGLDFITSVWTDHHYYKDEGKKYFGGGGWEQLWKYNATDSLMCAEAFPKQLKKLEEQNNIPTYERQRSIIPPLVYMQERGIRADIEGMIKRNKKVSVEIEELQEQLNSVAGKELNANSPKQLKEYFYGSLGHKAYVNRKTHSPTTDDNAMKRLARKGVEEARLVQRIRKLVKIRGTYIPIDEDGRLTKVDEDGRIRCSFNPVGTRYSRISSSENIFGTGMNMQNWPHGLLKYLLFDEGYIGYRIDLSQAENRIVAYVGNISQMIDAFESGIDVHRLTGSLIFQKPIEEVTTEDGTCALGDGTHSERFWAKKANHGLNYDLGYRNFALLYELPERQAMWIVDRYHMAYPGVRNNYHALVKRLLREGRTITNLMDRRTLFMDQWGDKLFKEAYSCIPQGTVGDVINERGVNYVYYNQEIFSSVELLLQVHDDITLQIPKSIGWGEHARILLDIKKSLETPLTTYDHRKFIIPADITVCPRSLSKEEGTELKSHEIPNNIELLAKKLEGICGA
uniref:Putative DNA polymerase n=1 Tax=viral metagenome TaxID=1070528 RepID=A0A6M3IN71_9ZZZZ